MAVVEDDTILHPLIQEDVLNYVRLLDDSHRQYTRFFDALLIQREQHPSFFRDLKAFREQPRIVALLDRAGQDKTQYREVTNAFLDSRFAHPWCQRTAFKKGSWRAEWGTIQGKQRDEEVVREELRLHKLLVPIWVCMRIKIFPGEDIVRDCLEKERIRMNDQKQLGKTDETLDEAGNVRSNKKLVAARNSLSDDDDHDVDHAPPAKGLRQVVSHSDLREQEEADEAAYAVTSIFRLAAAGALLAQQPRWKLRWLAKK